MIHIEDVRIERRLTGVALSRRVKDVCFKFDIDLAWCVGIVTDSCSVMASETKGAVHELSKKATNAKRCPCNNHILNNSLAKSSKVTPCRNASTTMRKVVAFANASAKRHKVFEEELEGMAVQGICETPTIFEIKRDCRAVGCGDKVTRIVPRQKHRENNQPSQSAEEYFRKSIYYIPLLDSIIVDLEERLSPEVLSLFQLGVFLPKSEYSKVDLVAVREAVKIYQKLLHSPHVSIVLSEFQLWVTKWKREVESSNKLPEFLPQIIEQCDTDLYPNIRVLLQILATLPVSAATADRSFSTLRRLKT
ncbi:zinc finger MYM-type protein 1-like [Aphis craccivora]|uniref:Zinc finger MYM-type protein 1-like n=1 Tax=Aphis craccivora TaxID=307492 RepID=A0A6G0YFF7_APHCR|nr:zinc finger MYM-type protein 1-like [Aphis craccivora]